MRPSRALILFVLLALLTLHGCAEPLEVRVTTRFDDAEGWTDWDVFKLDTEDDDDQQRRSERISGIERGKRILVNRHLLDGVPDAYTLRARIAALASLSGQLRYRSRTDRIDEWLTIMEGLVEHHMPDLRGHPGYERWLLVSPPLTTGPSVSPGPRTMHQ